MGFVRPLLNADTVGVVNPVDDAWLNDGSSKDDTPEEDPAEDWLKLTPLLDTKLWPITDEVADDAEVCEDKEDDPLEDKSMGD